MFGHADAYERFMGRWSRRLAPAFARFASLRDDEAVLDVGCGTGALSFAVLDATTTTRVTGVDLSEAYVTHAAGVRADPRISFRASDACALTFPDATFDRTLSMLVLNFVPSPARAVHEWKRVTKAGGLVAAAVWDYGDGMQMLRVFWDEATKLAPAIAPRDEARMPLCRAGELAALWHDAGFADVVEQPLVVELELASFDDYWEPFLLGQGPAGAYVASLSANDQDALRERLRGRLQDRGLEMTARAWAVRGRVPSA